MVPFDTTMSGAWIMFFSWPNTVVFTLALTAVSAVGLADPALAQNRRARPAARCEIWIYKDANFQGDRLVITNKETSSLANGWHDQASSAKVIAGSWSLYADVDFRGFMGNYKAGNDVASLQPNDQLDSLRCDRPTAPRTDGVK